MGKMMPPAFTLAQVKECLSTEIKKTVEEVLRELARKIKRDMYKISTRFNDQVRAFLFRLVSLNSARVYGDKKSGYTFALA
jgi:hypothetical protein